MTRAGQWMVAHDLDHKTMWWGLAWTALNIGVVALIMLLASAT